MVRQVASSRVSPGEPAQPGETQTSGETPWVEIEGALDEIAVLAAGNLSSAEFHTALIEKAAPALGAFAGAVWLRGGDGQLERAAQWNFASSGLDASAEASAAHRRILQSACERGQPCRVTMRAAELSTSAKSTAERPSSDPSTAGLVLSLAPLSTAGEPLGAIEFVQRGESELWSERDLLPLLAALAELAADFQRQVRLREFAQREGHFRQLEQFIDAVHERLELVPTAQAIVNEGRRLIGCDRLTLALWRRGKCRVVAASGSDTIERRSGLVRSWERLGERVLTYGEPIWFPAGRQSLPPAVEQALDACLDQSHARVLGAIPIVKRTAAGKTAGTQTPLGLLLVEQFQAAAAELQLVARTEAVGRHAASALANALEYQSLPLLPLERGLRGLGWLTGRRRLSRTLLALLTVALVAGTLVFYPADFAIESRGELQPARRRDVFAPSDAVVSQIHVAERADVQHGELLVTLHRPQLDFELQRVLGETQTARKRLAGVQAARLATERGKSDSIQRYNQLTAEEEELKEQLTSLAEQEQILREQLAELAVTSPIDGQILTWDVQQLLESRPVQRGQVLLAVGDLAGPWQLELRLPDDHAGYVLEAQQASRGAAGSRFSTGHRARPDLPRPDCPDFAGGRDGRSLRFPRAGDRRHRPRIDRRAAAGGERDRQSPVRPPGVGLRLVSRFDIAGPPAAAVLTLTLVRADDFRRRQPAMKPLTTCLILLSAAALGADAPSRTKDKPASVPAPTSDKGVKADSVLISLIDQGEIASLEPGMIAQIAIREGQLVAAGELLVQIDDAAEQIAVRKAQTERDIAAKEDSNTVKVRYAKDALATAKAEHQRANASIEKYRKSVTGSEIDQLRLAADQAALEVEQAEHNLAVAKLTTELKNAALAAATLDVERRKLVAPLDGMVVQIKRRRGEWVQAGESIVRIVRLDRLRVEGFVSAKQLDATAVGRPVTVVVDLPGRPKTSFAGKLVFVSPEVNPVNGQIRVWAELDNQDLLLRPGVAAEMTIEPAAASDT